MKRARARSTGLFEGLSGFSQLYIVSRNIIYFGQVKSKERALFKKLVPDSNQSTTGGKRAGSESSAQAVGVGLV